MNPAAAIGAVWDVLILQPVGWLLTNLQQAFATFGPTKAMGAFGLAVVVVTLMIRMLLFPLFNWQLVRSRQTQSEQRKVAPQLQELRRKYKRDRQKLNEETMKLYREHGISPFSGMIGCIPLLIQWPILIALYQAIRNTAGNLNSNLGFLWLPNVHDSVREASGVSSSAGVFDVLGGALAHPSLLILPLIAGAATFVQSKMMMPPQRPDMSDQERQAASIGRSIAYFMPIFIAFMALYFPFPQAIALYWVTQSIVMIGQQYYILGWGGLRVPDWFPGAGRVTKLSFPAAPAAALVSKDGGGKGRGASTATAARGKATGAGAPTKAAAGAAGGRQGGRAKSNGRAQSAGYRPRPAAASRSSSGRRRRGR